MGDVAKRCAAERLFASDPVLLTAGGSAFFDLCTSLPRALEGRATQVVLRSGCYLTFDDGYYRRMWARLVERTPAAATPRPRDLVQRAVGARARARDPHDGQARRLARHRPSHAALARG